MMMSEKPADKEIKVLTEQIIGCAVRIHDQLGPGFPKDIYENFMSYELKKRNLNYSNQSVVTVKLEGVERGNQKADLVVEDKIVVELKNADRIEDLFESQMLSYLNISGKQVGLIFNFGNEKLEIKRMEKKN